MLTWQELWPPYALRLAEGDLELTVLTDDDIPGLVELALEGLHDPEEMPFYEPWTQAPPEVLPANMVRHYSMLRSNLTPSHLALPFAVRVRRELVGVQSLDSDDFAVTQSAETGSWLGRRYQGRGIGTRMRRVVCAFAFDGLSAVEVTSSAFLDNPASLAVSRKVGYRPNGVVRLRRRPGRGRVEPEAGAHPGHVRPRGPGRDDRRARSPAVPGARACAVAVGAVAAVASSW